MDDKPRAFRRFYVAPEEIQNPRPEITGSDAGHIHRVLRLNAGDRVELFDGTGKGYRARIVSVSPGQVRLAIEGFIVLQSESPVHITLAQGMLKDRKMDDQIRQLTELGVTCWMPFYARRSVPLPSGKGLANRLERWEKIAVEAVKQCRRGCIPKIAPVDHFNDVLAAAADHDKKLLFWEGANRAFDCPESSALKIMVVIGPEGGFDPVEVQQASASGFSTAGLGPRILRAETAALAAFTLVQHHFGDMGITDR